MVIRTVHQILFSEANAVELTGYALKATRSVRSIFSDHEYRLWYLNDAVAFLKQHFPQEVTWAFDTLVPYAYKADLFKFCVLKVLGGWIVDAGVKMLKRPLHDNPEQPDPDFILFRSTGAWDPPWNCSMALIYAKPGHPVFDTAIEWVIENCRTRYYGHNPLMPTMATFGRSLAHHQVHENTLIGTVVDVRRRTYGRGFELKPIGIVAARKPRRAGAGQLGKLGFPGSNNYYQLWRAGQAYAAQENSTRRGDV